MKINTKKMMEASMEQDAMLQHLTAKYIETLTGNGNLQASDALLGENDELKEQNQSLREERDMLAAMLKQAKDEAMTLQQALQQEVAKVSRQQIQIEMQEAQIAAHESQVAAHKDKVVTLQQALQQEEAKVSRQQVQVETQEAKLGGQQGTIASHKAPEGDEKGESRALRPLPAAEQVTDQVKATAYSVLQRLQGYIKAHHSTILTEFRRMDKDNSGTLSAAELKQGFAKLGLVLMGEEWTATMAVLDVDGDGSVDIAELIGAMSGLKNQA